MDGHRLTYFKPPHSTRIAQRHLTVRTTPVGNAQRTGSFLVCRSTDQPHTVMVFTLKTISSDCRFYLPGFFFVFLLLFFVPAHHNHITTIFILNPSRFVSYIDARGSGLVGVLGVRDPEGKFWRDLSVSSFLFFSSLVDDAIRR